MDAAATPTTLHIVTSRMRYSNGRWFCIHQVFSSTERLGMFKSLAEAKRFMAGVKE